MLYSSLLVILKRAPSFEELPKIHEMPMPLTGYWYFTAAMASDWLVGGEIFDIIAKLRYRHEA